MSNQIHSIPIESSPVGAAPPPRRPRSRPPRTLVHAGPLVLARDGATSGLGRYLEREEDRELILLHRGQTAYREIARDTGVNAIRIEDLQAQEEELAAADMAIALGAEELEFAIDEPCLRNDAGRPIRELTTYEARAYAADARLPTRIRAKIDAGCSALERGLARVRIGHPAALDRERATTVFPDSPMDFGAQLSEPSDPEPPAAKEAGNWIQMDLQLAASREEPELPPLDLRAYRPSKRSRTFPRTTCEIGPKSPMPFPDLPEPYATYAIGARGRTRRRIARRS